MRKVQEITSADGFYRLELFQRDDSTFAFAELKNSGSPSDPHWDNDSAPASRFESAEHALQEAQGRVAWLRRESEWPARDTAPRESVEHTANWVKCPFCGIAFSLLDRNRWGGSRHLTCGQRILIMPTQERSDFPPPA